MPIYRQRPFVMIEKRFLRDNRLTYRERGILAHLHTMNSGDRIKDTELVTPSDDLYCIRASLVRLEELQYLNGRVLFTGEEEENMEILISDEEE